MTNFGEAVFNILVIVRAIILILEYMACVMMNFNKMTKHLIANFFEVLELLNLQSESHLGFSMRLRELELLL